MTTTPSHVVGLDIGGTSMVAGVIAGADAYLLSRRSVPTDSKRGPEDGLRRIVELIEHVILESGLRRERIGGIGVGCTGPVDSVTGRVNNPYTLPNWDDLPLIDHLTAHFQLPAYLLGDCQVAALGEHWAGAGKGARHVLYMTVGTGIGGGLILDGRLHRGVGLIAGEVGHQVIDLNGPDCYCGAKGCLEMLAAGPAIARRAAEEAPEDGLLLALADHDRRQITALLVSRAADQGDPFAAAVLDRTAFYLGVGLANVLNIITPEVSVLGGGVLGSWSRLAPTLIETVRSRAAMIPFAQMRIVPASLGLNAGITGAARAILDHLEGRV
ncbi:MAG TPA: ROK family protein [Aggregatilineales bacterium]|nr:ROK family protein [Aggregatilineales bacterium]